MTASSSPVTEGQAIELLNALLIQANRGLEPLMSTEEVAKVLRYSPDQLNRLINEKKIDLEPTRRGRPHYFDPKDVRAYIERCKARGGAKGGAA